MPETPTFGRHAEIPYDKMTPEQQEAAVGEWRTIDKIRSCPARF
jgi:hypothetical protein